MNQERFTDKPNKDGLNLEWHALNVGLLISKLQAIEFMARITRDGVPRDARDPYQKSNVRLDDLRVGDVVDSDALTCDDDLRNTLERYNKVVGPANKVDIDPVVALRDAISHGKMYGLGPTAPLKLLKFSKALADGKVRVEFSEWMTPAWFEEKHLLLAEAQRRIICWEPPPQKK